MNNKIKVIKKSILNYLEDILFIFSFLMFDIAMFNISLTAGLICTSIIIFIIACVVLAFKIKGSEHKHEL